MGKPWESPIFWWGSRKPYFLMGKGWEMTEISLNFGTTMRFHGIWSILIFFKRPSRTVEWNLSYQNGNFRMGTSCYGLNMGVMATIQKSLGFRSLDFSPPSTRALNRFTEAFGRSLGWLLAARSSRCSRCSRVWRDAKNHVKRGEF